MSAQAVSTAEASTLSSYLTDHLAGSKAAVELVQNCHDENEGTPVGELMARLGPEIESDRGTLQDLMTRLGVEPSRVKQAGGWMLERLSRVRLNERVTGSAATTRLMQLETLSLGIEGKRLLWIALKQVAEGDLRLQGVAFDNLIARAESQRQQVEPFRVAAAAEGLTTA